MERINYFILIGISFDPIETSEDIIRDAINNKKEMWSKDVIKTSKRNECLANLQKIDDIFLVLLDPAKREREAELAKEIRNNKYNELKNIINIKEIKGYIELKEVEELVNKFRVYGLGEAEIELLISKPVIEVGPINIEENINKEFIDKIIALELENNLKVLESKYDSLYSFLGESKDVSTIKLREKANEKLKKLGNVVNKSGKLNAEQVLSGICLRVFKNDQYKYKYDNYIEVTKYSELNKYIEAGVEVVDVGYKKITQSVLEKLIEIAIEKYKVNKEEALKYISGNCLFNDIILEDKSQCAFMKTNNKVVCTKCNEKNTCEKYPYKQKGNISYKRIVKQCSIPLIIVMVGIFSIIIFMSMLNKKYKEDTTNDILTNETFNEEKTVIDNNQNVEIKDNRNFSEQNEETISINMEDKFEFDIGSKWEGTYVASQGETGVTLEVNEKDVVFNFWPLESNSDILSGSYSLLKDNIDYDKGYISLIADAWINQPNNYVMLNVNGIVDGDVFKGEVISIRDDSRVGDINLTKVNKDTKEIVDFNDEEIDFNNYNYYSYISNTGCRYTIPNFLIKDENDKINNLSTFYSRGKNIKLSIYSSNNYDSVSVDDMYNSYLNNNTNIELNVKDNDKFTISGFDGDNIYYYSAIVNKNKLEYFEIIYPKKYIDEFNSIVENLYRCLKPNNF